MNPHNETRYQAYYGSLKSKVEKRLDVLQTAGDVAGMTPGWGLFADVPNTGLYLLRGKWSDFGWGAVACLPVVGQVGTTTKWGKRGLSKVDDVLKYMDRAGGLNLFKWGDRTSTISSGWRKGDFFLHLPDMGTPKLNWKQNAGRLREYMRKGAPIFDSYINPQTGKLIPTKGFLNAERELLKSRGWVYSQKLRAWIKP